MPKEDKNNKAKTQITRNTWMLILFGALGLIGLILVIIYMVSMNMLAGAPGVILCVAAGFGIWYFWKGKEEFTSSSAITQSGKKLNKEPANSLVISKLGKIDFMEIYEPVGIARKCRNDKRFYHVLDNRSDNQKLELQEFILPDQQIYNPNVFAERVIELPAHRKLFTSRQTLGQYIKTGLLVVAMVVIGIIMIATTGGN